MNGTISLAAVVPELVVCATGCLVLLLGQSYRGRRLIPWITLVALAVAVVLVHQESAWISPNTNTSGSGLAYGSLAMFVRLSALIIGIVLTLVNWAQARDEEQGDYVSMMLFSLTGLLLVAPANDLLVLFLALELTSIPTYVMVVLSRSRVQSAEAGTKYFFIGAMAAAIMAYGFSLLFGIAGSASLDAVSKAVYAALGQPGTLEYGIAIVGLSLSIGGFLFKIAAVPLHFYIADVYQGAASPVAGLLGFVPKLAGIVAILKIVAITGQWTNDGTGSLVTDTGVFWVLWIIAVATMTVGNLLALRQTNIKRLLAYSGVAHSGYMLVGILAGPLAGLTVEGIRGGPLGNGAASVLFYMVIYGIANLGAFAVLGLLRTERGDAETMRDVAGLVRREPTLALLLALSMFTLMGLPPTPGFWGKLGIFSSAFSASQTTTIPSHATWLIVIVIIGVLNSALAAAYYLRVIASVLVYESDEPAEARPREALNVGALLCGFLLLIFTFWPNGLLTTAQTGSQELATAAQTARLDWNYPPAEEPAAQAPESVPPQADSAQTSPESAQLPPEAVQSVPEDAGRAAGWGHASDSSVGTLTPASDQSAAKPLAAAQSSGDAQP